jgi:hypothetical protein
VVAQCFGCGGPWITIAATGWMSWMPRMTKLRPAGRPNWWANAGLALIFARKILPGTAGPARGYLAVQPSLSKKLSKHRAFFQKTIKHRAKAPITLL